MGDSIKVRILLLCIENVQNMHLIHVHFTILEAAQRDRAGRVVSVQRKIPIVFYLVWGAHHRRYHFQRSRLTTVRFFLNNRLAIVSGQDIPTFIYTFIRYSDLEDGQLTLNQNDLARELSRHETDLADIRGGQKEIKRLLCQIELAAQVEEEIEDLSRDIR